MEVSSLRRPRRLLLPALLAVALLLAGCEVSIGDKTIDAGSVEEQIARNVEAQGAKVDGVDCPGDQEAARGVTFPCTVTFDDGRERTAEVELVDDEGTFRYKLGPVADAEGEDEGGGGGTGSGRRESGSEGTGPGVSGDGDRSGTAGGGG